MVRTAGANNPCQTDLNAYHFIIDGNGKIFNGKYKPEDNINCQDGKYAPHTGGGNTGSIGISMCGMYTPVGKSIKETPYPLTRIQCEKCFELIAKLAKQYNIPITPQNIMTHYEFGLNHPKTTSAGKIDIVWLAPFPYLSRYEIGDFIRSKVRWYYEKNK